MKIIVGLGNPGEKYENTRHNIGFLVLDILKNQIPNPKSQIPNFIYESEFNAEVCKLGDLLLVKPQTFMNASGMTVRKLVGYFRVAVADVWVVHDDLDLEMGKFKMQFGKGPKVHKGVCSVEQELGSKDFWRVRVGVDARKREIVKLLKNQIPGREYVLMKLTMEEKKILSDVCRQIATELTESLTD